MKKNILLYTFIGLFLASITTFFIIKNKKKEIVHYGRLKTSINVYNNASVDVFDSYQLELSDMYFRNDLIVEKLQKNDFTKNNTFNLIFDGFYINANSLDELSFSGKKMKLEDKYFGAIFIYDSIRGYDKRKPMTDTILHKQYLKRFYIQMPNDFSVFYIDTTLQNLPYSFNFIVDRDYKGSLVRVDTYQSDIDKFTTLKLEFTDTIPQNMYDALNRLYTESK